MSENSRRAFPLRRAEAKHRNAARTFQGIPGIAVSGKGRLFACWYSGGHAECAENFVGIAVSDDRGGTWTDFEWVVDPAPPEVRAFDPTLWRAPDGRIWLFWAQCVSRREWDIFDGENGVWCSCLADPDAPVGEFVWSPPVRVADGVMMNKPRVLSDGAWALPVSVWSLHPELGDPANFGAKIVISTDGGKTFAERGKAAIPAGEANFDEHCIVELPDRRLAMLIRCLSGYLVSYSSDMGRNWTPAVRSAWRGPCSRAFLGQLASGRYLMIGNDSRVRTDLTAYLADGELRRTAALLLDPRMDVSYPDADQAPDGTIYIIWDRDRRAGGFIYLARLHEEDLLAGRRVHPDSCFGIEISHSRPVPAKE